MIILLTYQWYCQPVKYFYKKKSMIFNNNVKLSEAV